MQAGAARYELYYLFPLTRQAETLRLVERTMLFAGGVLVLLLVGIAAVVTRQVVRPVRQAAATAERLAAGRLRERMAVRGEDDLATLAASFNRMADTVQQQISQLRELSRLQRRFVADASHELRTPLTSIRGFAELHRMGATDSEEVGRTMGRIEDEAKRMGLLVDDLLLLARLDQQRPIERAPVDLLDVAADVVEEARRVAPARSIELRAHPAVPPVVIGDEARLRQVLRNLMSNALTHTPDDAAIAVDVAVSPEAPVVTVEVSDTGPGLAPEDAAHVFERFYRADPARARNAGGSGLGLSIVAGLVEAHGGKVSVVSSPGEGATFRVELPLAPS